MSGQLSHVLLAKMLAASCLLGLAAGLFYDVFRIRRIAFKIKWLMHVEDALFMVALSPIFATLFYVFNNGRVRVFAFFGCAFGFWLYRKTAGRLVIFFADKIIAFVKKTVNILVIKPIKFILTLSRRAFDTAVRTLKKLFGRIYIKCARKKTDKCLENIAESALYGFKKTGKIKKDKKNNKNKIDKKERKKQSEKR